MNVKQNIKTNLLLTFINKHFDDFVVIKIKFNKGKETVNRIRHYYKGVAAKT